MNATGLSVFGLLGFIALLVSAKQDWKPLHVQPEHIHLSLGEQQNEFVVTWTTFDQAKTSTCNYGINAMDQVAHGKDHKFVDGGNEKRHMYIHRVYLKGLKANTSYKYHCGSEDGWSDVFFFKTLPEGENWSPKFVVYGDLGNINGRTLGRLQDEIQRGEHDMILHVGDMAYDLHTDNARVGDEFMKQIEPIAAYVPYQVCPGNHEHQYNFSNYVNRFSMHSQGDKSINNFFWSYNIGPAHIIAFTTEFHYYTGYGTHQIMNQYRWLEKDLIKANLPENRAKHPWIITMGHRPIYVQNHVVELLRVGTKAHPGFEHLFYKYGVDLEFWAHEHNYERIFPIYDNKIHKGSNDHPYTNPKAPVHITTGSAGCRENHTHVSQHRKPYSAFAIQDYGFTNMKVINHTHLHLQQISEDKHGKIIDDFYLIKEKHGPEAWH